MDRVFFLATAGCWARRASASETGSRAELTASESPSCSACTVWMAGICCRQDSECMDSGMEGRLKSVAPAGRNRCSTTRLLKWSGLSSGEGRRSFGPHIQQLFCNLGLKFNNEMLNAYLK